MNRAHALESLKKAFFRYRGQALRFLARDDGTLRLPPSILSSSIRDDIVFAKSVSRWFRDRGDTQLRLNYPDLTSESVVFDLGGYRGQFASDIHSRYRSEVFVFEPYGPFFQNLSQRFSGNPRIHVFPFALGSRDESQKLFFDDDATSLYRETGRSEVIQIKNFESFVRAHSIESIDLIKINIEGAEYDFLEGVISKGLQPMLRNIQVQFHKDVRNARQRMLAIREALLKTHRLTYSYEFVWDNYQLRA